MKKHCRLLLLVAALCFLGASPVFAAKYLSINTDNANVRTGPGTKYPVTMELFEGYPLKVLKTEGDWYKVTDFEKDTGWVHKSIVKERDSVIVNARKSLNMRSGPTTKDKVVAELERGVVLIKLESNGKWTKVRHITGRVGWVYSPLLWP